MLLLGKARLHVAGRRFGGLWIARLLRRFGRVHARHAAESESRVPSDSRQLEQVAGCALARCVIARGRRGSARAGCLDTLNGHWHGRCIIRNNASGRRRVLGEGEVVASDSCGQHQKRERNAQRAGASVGSVSQVRSPRTGSRNIGVPTLAAGPGVVLSHPSPICTVAKITLAASLCRDTRLSSALRAGAMAALIRSRPARLLQVALQSRTPSAAARNSTTATSEALGGCKRTHRGLCAHALIGCAAERTRPAADQREESLACVGIPFDVDGKCAGHHHFPPDVHRDGDGNAWASRSENISPDGCCHRETDPN
jgi:hypothetical protein